MAEHDHKRDAEEQGGVGVLERKKEKTQKPRMYRVLLHNDDFTPMEFVVGLVQQLFRKTFEDAMQITLQVHERGLSVAGVYTREIAETKVAQVHNLARRNDHPLMSSIEPEE